MVHSFSKFINRLQIKDSFLVIIMKEQDKKNNWFYLSAIILITIGVVLVLILSIFAPSKLRSIGKSNSSRSNLGEINESNIVGFSLVFNQGNDKISVKKSDPDIWVFENKPTLMAPKLVVQSVFSQIQNLETCQNYKNFTSTNWSEITNLTAEIFLQKTNDEIITIKIGEPKAVDFGYYIDIDSDEIMICPFEQIVDLLNTFYFDLLPIQLKDS